LNENSIVVQEAGYKQLQQQQHGGGRGCKAAGLSMVPHVLLCMIQRDAVAVASLTVTALL
jgi:hypothetical protein